MTAPVPTLDLNGELGELFEQFLSAISDPEAAKPLPLRDWMDLAEAWRIIHALRTAKGNRSEAARQLGIGRRTLYSKMEKLGIEPNFTVRADSQA